jgi:glyoxylase-like metal-dependent hydrolase (beta-lactamase superfamily II)
MLYALKRVNMHVESFFDFQTKTFTHIVVDETTKKCAIIDSVLDYNQDSARISTQNADKIIKYIQDNNLKNEWILETHIHADHLTAAFYLKQHVGGKLGIGNGISQVLKTWVPLFNTENDTPITGEQFDHLFHDGECLTIGTLSVRVMHTPGHTPACITYIVNETCAFVGDTIFNPKLGTARVDFPGGSSTDLYNSIQRIYSLPEDIILYMCHDYPTLNEENPLKSITVGAQKAQNIMLNAQTTLKEFQDKRIKRDKTLGAPKLILPSIQVNMRAGNLGHKAENNIQYIKIPMNTL